MAKDNPNIEIDVFTPNSIQAVNDAVWEAVDYEFTTEKANSIRLYGKKLPMKHYKITIEEVTE